MIRSFEDEETLSIEENRQSGNNRKQTKNEVNEIVRFVNKHARTHSHTRDKSRTVKQRPLIGQQLGHVITRGTAYPVVNRRDADPALCTVVFAAG